MKIAATSLHSIHNLAVPDKLLNPPNCHSVGPSTEHPAEQMYVCRYSRALSGICKLLMVPNQMFLVPGVLFHSLVVFEAFEHYLAEAVKVGHVGHLRVVELGH